MKVVKRLTGSLAGIGFLPAAPGTWASIITVIILYLLYPVTGLWTAFIMLSTGTLLTLWSADTCEEAWGPDPPKMTIDEFSGQSVVFMLVPFSGSIFPDLPLLVTGFALFRFFDIMKPLGIRQLQHLPSGFGILLDDILAGIYGCILLNLIVTFLFSV